ncbi:MAG: hypothetical protein NVV62_19425 [Terricaulis sp.]|nr:hypothetical protein [Terricaulis sp.]
MSDMDSVLENLPALEAPYKDYWERLGAFIGEFSATERALVACIRDVANLNSEVGRSLLGSIRVHDGIGLLNRVLDAAGKHRARQRLRPVLAQLGEINTTRNNIIHWGVEKLGAHEFLVSNKHLVSSAQVPQAYTVTPETLFLMSMDLIKIRIHLVIEGMPSVFPRDFYRRVGRPVLRDAWSYKAPQRGAPAQRNPDKRRARKPPPPPSGG